MTIVRGKVKNSKEFGVKIDISQANGFVRAERLFFEAFKESINFILAVTQYRERTEYYPERVLVDKIYRTRENFAYCKEYSIRLADPKLGRPSKEADKQQMKKL